jgi:hypothetical protein
MWRLRFKIRYDNVVWPEEAILDAVCTTIMMIIVVIFFLGA